MGMQSFDAESYAPYSGRVADTVKETEKPAEKGAAETKEEAKDKQNG